MANNCKKCNIKLKIKKPINIERHRKPPLTKEEKRLKKNGDEDEDTPPADANYNTLEGWIKFLNKI